MTAAASENLPRPDRAQLAAAIAELQAALGDRVSTAAGICEQHGNDPSYHASARPDAVVFAHETADVQRAVQICAAHRIPIIAFGAGTSLEGHIAAICGGVSIDTSNMNQVLHVHSEDFSVSLQAGVDRERLNRQLRPHGLFFPVDPGANATLGGMAATRASGTNAVRYGTMRDNVLALEVVLADGRIIRTGTRARKSSAGYDLTGLLVGSEGTLGIITELTLRTYGLPEHVAAATCAFADLRRAVEAVIEIMQFGIPVARIEFLDETQVDAINRYCRTNLPTIPTLFFEFHGSEASVAEHLSELRSIVEEHGATALDFASTPEERERLWHARHNAYFAALALAPDKHGVTTDVCVPISRLADCITATKADLDQSGFVAPVVGHVGDGNFHVIMLVNPDDAEEMQRAEDVHRRMVHRALSMDGTCTGEHGIGCGKREFLSAEHGEAVEVMRALKHSLDPHNLLNPGKLLPPQS